MSSRSDKPQSKFQNAKRHRKPFIIFILIVTALSAAYRATYFYEQWNTALLFIFLPACFAIALTLLPESKKSISKSVRVTVLAILVGMVILPEGLICWIMFMPIALLSALSVGLSQQQDRHYFFLPLLLLLGTEGVVLDDMIDPNNTVEASVVVEMDEAQLHDRLAMTPDFDNDKLPVFLKAGFPTPAEASGSGLQVGDTRTIKFSGEGSSESNQLELRITHKTDNSVIFTPTGDSTMIGQWLTYDSIVISWTKASQNSLRVRWEINYTRNMHPGWYFDPLQQYGMDKAADYLLESFVG